MSQRLPLSVQHEVPTFLGPLTTFLLWLAVAAGQFDPVGERLLYPYVVVALLPPVARAVWSFLVHRPVVTGVLDQRIVGTDVLLVTIALLQAGASGSPPLLLVMWITACVLGLILGPRRVAPAVALGAVALVLCSVLGALGMGVTGVAAAVGGLAAFGLLPAYFLHRTREEGSRAQETLEALERTARDLNQDSLERQDEVRRAVFSPEVVEEELQALGVQSRDWLTQTCRTLVAGTGADRCLVYRATRDAGNLELQAQSDASEDVIGSIRPREGVFGVVFKTGESLLMPTVGQSQTSLSYTSDAESVGSVLAVPLHQRGGLPWGIVILDAREREGLTEADRELAEGVARLLLTLFQQLTDLTAYRRGSGEDKMLHETSQALAEQDSLDALAEVLVERCTQLVAAQAGALTMLEDDGTLEVLFSTGFPDDPTGVAFPFDKTTSLVSQSMHYAQTICQTGLGISRKPARLFGADRGPDDAFTDVMVMPLWKPGAGGDARVCIGAICLCRDDDCAFQEDDQARAEMLANQAAAHIMNLRLLDESRTRAATDGLTGLPNRRSFVEKMDEMLHRAARFGTPVSLLIMDTDHFKNVNDTYGHPVGDQVLRRLAGLLHDSVRDKVDMAARYGGEEFAVLLENTPHEGALNLGERLRGALEDETFIHMEGSQANQFHVTMSIGVASYPEAGDAMVLVGKADEALYEAKQSGRNRVVSAHGMGTPSG